MVRLKDVYIVICIHFCLFQFLMVRLKASGKSLSAVISIFQFLMVRLKEIISCILALALINFNSLWCD